MPALHMPALLRTLIDYFAASVRAKLLFLVLAPLLIGFPVMIALVWYWSNTHYHQLLTYKVGSDLVSAHAYFDGVVQGVGARVETLAGAQRLHAALASGEDEQIDRELELARQRDGLDFLYLLDAQGKVRRGAVANADGSDHSSWPVVRDALAGKARSAIDIYDESQLAAVHASLAARAGVNLVPTEQAAPDERRSENRGMLIHAAAPVQALDGRLIGIVEGGTLLNGNLGIVDAINALVYREEVKGAAPDDPEAGAQSLQASQASLSSPGTATLFLGDTRIATNVRLFAGERALGTRVSQKVREHVLENGNTWLDTAFVVNDWYVSGYEPVLDSFGERVGMLYVGFLESPFREVKEATLSLIFVFFAAVSLVGCAWSLRWAWGIFKPILRMTQTIQAIDGGDIGARVGDTGSRDELGRLAGEFDHLLDVLAQKRDELQRWANELEDKVAERTAQLEQADGNLRQAQRQLMMSEKLAAIGELTAGVAHEINNPVAVIQGNLDVMREVLGPEADAVSTEIRLIDEQVNRIRLIVTKLLQFARPGDFAGYVEGVDIAAVFADCLILSRHHLVRRSVKVVQDYTATCSVQVNRHELQQVLINLIVNAVQAMPDGGTLTLASRDWDAAEVPGAGGRAQRRGVRIEVSDTGEGIRPEDIDRIFDPFFTTKKMQGTGLGLSISYSLVERYGGRIEVSSRPGEGAVFAVLLLCEPEYGEAP